MSQLGEIGQESFPPTGRHLELVPDLDTTMPSPHEGPDGVLLPLPKYDTEVDLDFRKELGSTKHEYIGTTWLEEWQMSDGTRYKILIGEPAKTGIEIPVVKDTALGTQPEGFNEDVARTLMKLGFPVVIKGPEIGSSIPLSHSSHNTHKILDVASKRGYFSSEYAAVEGYSRGAMLAFGTFAYANQSKRKIIYGNLTDPCVEHEVTFDNDRFDDLREKGLSEAISLAQQLGKLVLNPAKAFRYRKTVDLSLEGAKQFYRTAKPVFSGEAGLLARHMPADTKATVGFFRNSIANDEAEYTKILRQYYPGIVIKNPNGGHSRGMDERILLNIAKRFVGLSAQLGDGVTPDTIDYSLVHKPDELDAA